MRETSAQICRRMGISPGDKVRRYYHNDFDEWVITGIGRDEVLAVWMDPDGIPQRERVLVMAGWRWEKA